ncbi:MAG: cytochrome c [Deltaproteobacteria bacterium]|nr:cytochrome c [Deltaproteobacteria bacterium]
MKGLVIGGVGILHVFLAQFAIGGGALLYYFERVAQRGDADARRFVDGYFKVLVLVSFVVGALTGVAMWFTTIQVGARTIGLMIDEFHWLWATEWVWFSVEICAGYAFYRVGPRLDGRARLRLLGLYAFASWMSLFWINGILAWQLTPGAWLDGGGVWAGFFNPSFWPSLLFRTAVAATLAALVACVVINTMTFADPQHQRERRAALIRRAARFAVPIVAMPLLAAWFLAVIPSDSRGWVMGGSLPMTMFVGVAAGASMLIGAYVILGILLKRLTINIATATMLLLLAFGATAAGEFVREGARKPFTVRGVLYSTSIRPEEVAALRAHGAVANDPYPLRDEHRYPTAQLVRGAKVHRALCDACHTMHGSNALTELVRTWSDDQLRLNIAKLQRTKGFMPPFAGNAEDVESLAQLLRWELAGAPTTWPPPAVSRDERPPIPLEQISKWLDEAGTEPAKEAP